MARSKPQKYKQRYKPYDAARRPNGVQSTRAGGSQTHVEPTQSPDRGGAAKPVDDLTPVRVGGVADMAQAEEKETHRNIDHLVAGEIKGSVCMGLKGLDLLKLPNKAIKFDPDAIFKSIKKEGELYRDGRWLDFPDSSTQGQKEGELEKIFNNLGDAVAKYKKGAGPRRQWSSRFANTHVEHARCERKPDVVLMNTKYTDTKVKVGWSRIFVVTEHKAGTSATMEDMLQQLAHTSRLIFGTQQDRRFVLGIALLNNSMTLVVFNRGGVLASDTFDVHTSPERFVRIVGGLIFADRVHLGFDPSMRLTEIDDRIGRYVKINRKRYDIEEVIHVESVIRGRATVCLKVTRKGKTYVVKNSWVDVTRKPKEPDIMAILEGVRGVPTLVSHEYLRTKSDSYDTTTSDIDALEANGTMTKDYASVCRKKLDKRQQLRVVLSPFGSHLREFRSLRELLHAMIGVVDALERLHGKGVLHRDISLRNILLSDEENELGEREGLVIDLDYAIENEKHSKAAACHRTGTYPFMAIELLNTSVKVVHKYYHDLESVFYVLCYLCCTSAGPHGAKREDFNIASSPLQFWFPQKTKGRDMQGTSYSKKGVIVDSTDFEVYILSSLDRYFDQPAIRTCLDGLRALLFPERLRDADRAALLQVYGCIDIDRLPRHEREPKDFFAAYREILQTAHDNVHEPAPSSTASTGTEASILSQAEEELDWRLLDAQEIDPKDASASGRSGSVGDQVLGPATQNPSMSQTRVDSGNATRPKRKKKVAFGGEVDPDSPLAKRTRSGKTLVGTRSDSYLVLEPLVEEEGDAGTTLVNGSATRDLRSKATSQPTSPVDSESGVDLPVEPHPMKRMTRSMTRAMRMRKAKSSPALIKISKGKRPVDL